MNASQFLFSLNMSADQQRIHQLKHHINQLLVELKSLESNSNPIDELKPFQLTIQSPLTPMSKRESRSTNHPCPCLSSKRKSNVILHSTKNSEKILQSPIRLEHPVPMTSTPKATVHVHRMHKPNYTSTPRRGQRRSTVGAIPLKRLLYKKATIKLDSHRHLYSAALSIRKREKFFYPHPQFYSTENTNTQWI